MRSGRRIAFDVGRARVGVAVSDFHAILATPIALLVRGSELDAVVSAAAQLVSDIEAIEVYIGLPINLKNESTLSTKDAVSFALALAGKTLVPVRFIDERLTTSSAAQALRAAGHNAKTQKSLIDSAAAAVILEQALAQEKHSGDTPGTAIEDY